jgi:putative DNA primase/helicase
MAVVADPGTLRRIADRVQNAGDPPEIAAFMSSYGNAPKTPPRGPAAAPRSPRNDDDTLESTLTECAKLDQSDTDNGRRLILHFGKDLTVRAEAEIEGGSFLVWMSSHWDIDDGASGALQLAQKVGPLIKLEAEYLRPTAAERAAIEAGGKMREEAEKNLEKRRAGRWKFGIESKNRARAKAMLDMAAPHIRRPLEAFNADPLLVASRTHTLRFVKHLDPECPDPDITRVLSAEVQAIRGHRREDFLTSVVPVDYDPHAQCPRWEAFMARFQPDEPTRRTVQQFTGLGLTGLAIQRFMFHHGVGANGKSVFLEVITRLLGSSLAIGLPVESIMAATAMKSSGQASPDIARLFGKRMVRVVELPGEASLSIDVVKKLTGGEAIPVRTLYKGFFEFQPLAKPHFSTNGQPRIDDASNAIWRRMLRVEWPVALPEHEQRDFEEVVREFLEDAPGILNWLIKGVIDYLEHGLVVSAGVISGTQAYRDDMDPTGPFARECIRINPEREVREQEMYEAYARWSIAAGERPLSRTRFGRMLKRKVPRDDQGSHRRYVGVELHNVPSLNELTVEQQEALRDLLRKQ